MEQDKLPKYNFGKMLQKLLDQSGRTATSVAEAIGVPSSTFHNWLSGVNPGYNHFESIFRLADELEVSFESLFFTKKRKKRTVFERIVTINNRKYILSMEELES